MNRNNAKKKRSNNIKSSSCDLVKKNIKRKIKSNKNILFSIGSKGFTLIELIATIAIISIISTVAILSVTTLIKNSKEKSLQTTYSSLKETGVALSKELTDDYWEIDKLDDGNYIYVSCVSVKDMKNNGYYKDSDFESVDGISDKTFVIVKKDYDSKVITSSEIDDVYCAKSFNTANLKVKSYTHSTISVNADCGSGEYKYEYYIADKYIGVGSKNYTYTGLNENTKYNLKVVCSKNNDNVSKTGNVEQSTGIKNNISFVDTCTSNPINVTINYNYGDNYFFKLTSSGNINSKYNALECYELDANSCSSNVSTYVKANTWYRVSSNSIIVSINNNGSIYAYSSSNGDIKYSSSLTNTITMIDKSIPNIPTLNISDNIQSGNWHKSNYSITLSNGESDNVNTKCKGVVYQVSTDNSNFTDISGTSKSFSNEENKTYYFRSKGKNGNYSESISYNSKNDKTKPVCNFSSISTIRKTKSSSVTLTCTDDLSGVVSKKLTSSNFELKNIIISNISDPVSISNGYKYTVDIQATDIGTGSYIGLKSDSVLDNAKNGNSVSKSNTFQVLPNTYTVSYNTNGGTGCSNSTVTYGETYGTLCTTTKTGYTFSGWYDSNSYNNKITSSSTYNVESDQTLYAKWDVNYYYFDLNGYLDGNSSGGISGYGTADVYINGNLVCNDCTDYYQQQPYGTTYKITDIKATTGHTYNGVYSGNLSGTITGYTATSLKFSTNSYTVTYNTDGGTSCSSQNVTYGSSYGTLCTTTKSGYTFNGWYNGSTKVTSSSTHNTAGNVTLTASWSENIENINKYRCSGSDLYYITTCGLGTGKCNYTYKNDSNTSGTVDRSNLSDEMTKCSNYQVNNSSTYTKTINRALELVSDSNTIKILNDNTDVSDATVSKNVTIDTNGKTVTRSSVINVNSGYTLTMNGTGGILNTSSRIFSVSGTLKIQGGTYKNTSSAGETSDVVYLNSSGNIDLNDVNKINLWSDNGCGAAIESVSSNSINVNATNGGIYLYGRCYGIRASKADVSVSSSYDNSVNGVYNYIHGEYGYAIAGNNIYFGTEYSKQTTETAYYPIARSNNYTTNTTNRMAVLNASSNIYFKSGDIYSSFKAGTYQSDGDKPTYSGPGDTYKSVDIGNLITNKKVISPSGYTVKYFTSSSASGNVVALRIVKN